MKYKIEFWLYGEFETVEAAERLNQRAAEGWELVNITGGSSDISSNHVMWRFALYRKNPAAVNFRYTADIVNLEASEDYIDFCREAGWEKVIVLNSGMCIFLSKDGTGKPLHTSSEVEFEYQLQVLSENHVSTSVGYYILWIAVACGFLGVFGWKEWSLVKDGAGEDFILWFLPFYAVLFLKEPLGYSVNLLYLKYARRCMDAGKAVKRPGWISKLSGFLAILTEAVVLYIAVVVVVRSICKGASPVPICAALLAGAVLNAAAVWVKLFKNKMGLGSAMSLAGLSIALIVPMLLV